MHVQADSCSAEDDGHLSNRARTFNGSRAHGQFSTCPGKHRKPAFICQCLWRKFVPGCGSAAMLRPSGRSLRKLPCADAGRHVHCGHTQILRMLPLFCTHSWTPGSLGKLFKSGSLNQNLSAPILPGTTHATVFFNSTLACRKSSTDQATPTWSESGEHGAQPIC